MVGGGFSPSGGMADAADLKSADCNGRGGSSPPLGSVPFVGANRSPEANTLVGYCGDTLAIGYNIRMGRCYWSVPIAC